MGLNRYYQRRASFRRGLLPWLLAGCVSGDHANDTSRPGPQVIDGHNDFLIHFIDNSELKPASHYDLSKGATGQTDIERWRKGNVIGSFVTVDGSFHSDTIAGLRNMITLVRRIEDRYRKDLVVVTRPQELAAATIAGRIGLILHIEGAEQLGGAGQYLPEMHELGVRSVGLVWNTTNTWADAALDSAQWGGISKGGASLVQDLNRLGIIVDLSHAADSTVADVVRLSRAPIILSHSSARGVASVPRNVPDELLREVGRNGGVIMVTFVPYLTTTAYARWYARGEEVWDSLNQHDGSQNAGAKMTEWEQRNPAPHVVVSDVADHVEHVARIAGVDHVGIGSDFDGMYGHVEGLDNVGTFQKLMDELRIRGWSQESLNKVAGQNVFRVWRAVESVGQAMSRAKGETQ